MNYKFMGKKWEDNPLLKEKQKELDGIVEAIKLHSGQALTNEQNTNIENWQGRLEFRLNELVLESKIKEIDLKISVFKEVLKESNRI